jgi:hypothetical protein
MDKSKPESHSALGARINKWGVSGIALTALALAIPFRHPVCLLWPPTLLAALACCIVAAVRGNKLWPVLSVISAALAAQAALAVFVEC